MQKSTAREEILSAVKIITEERDEEHFSLSEVLEYMERKETTYKVSTIRTHITSRCCTNAPNHHGTVFNDYERIGKGLYRLIH
ncbi:hypothetical protein [Planococcus sp. S3-L1]|uniref:DUF7669 domain-containing protein n=1 Tax=Planococcus sp. S3-L1 TaxID=3046200 RepID=UPI0024B8F303|nr:hypothetical protein [Planococcus sp. S3-L1]MDJ0331777.1 hypothetical protein [Planococcus sp. S3-L1]